MDFELLARNMPFFLGGVLVTFKLFIIAWAGSFALGIVIAFLRLSSRKVIYWPVTLYVQVTRSVPLLLIILWFYFLFPIFTGKAMPNFWSAVVAFIVFEAVGFSEIIRAGIKSVRKNLTNAGYSTGLSYVQVMSSIVLPQAIRNMVPSLVTQSVIVFQDTALAYIIGVREFLRSISLVNAREFRSVELYLLAMLFYLVICSTGSQLARRLEKRQKGYL